MALLSLSQFCSKATRCHVLIIIFFFVCLINFQLTEPAENANTENLSEQEEREVSKGKKMGLNQKKPGVC